MTQTTAPPRYYTMKTQVPLGAGQGLYFTAGKGYHVGPAHPLRTGTAPPTDLQTAQKQVATTMDPVAASYKDAAAQSSTQQAQAIKDATSSLAALMGQYGPTAQSAYTGAAAGQAAVDAATAATRQGQGADAQAELAAKLAAIHTDPATAARISGGQSSNLAGEAQAAAGRGASSLSALLAGGAHAADYAAQLPGIAGATGLRALQQSEGQISSKLADQLSALEAQRPGAVQAALAQIQNQHASAAKAKAAASQQAFENRFKVGQANEHVDEFNAKQALAGQKIELEAGHYKDLSAQAWARIGISNESLQLRAKALDKKQANGGFTPSELNTFHSTAYGIAQDSLNGYVDAKGNQVAPRSYQEALDWMIRSKVPPAVATKVLNATFPETRLPVTAKTRSDYSQTTMAGPLGHVTMAPGADRAGVPTTPIVKEFVGLLAGSLGAPLTIGTGSNHNEMTTDGNVSDHWTGHASDVTIIGNHSFNGSGPGHIDPVLTRAGQQALVLAGMPPAQAARQQGGLYNLNVDGHRVQIIFNSFEGGNHYNHLHIGISKGGA